MTTNLKIDPYGFREYDARWLYEKDINQLGIENLGKGLGTQIIKHTKKTNPRVIVGHDYRSYSEEIKSALKKGLNLFLDLILFSRNEYCISLSRK
jgi:phosphomannomutase/phosphoglucomutase